MSIQCKKKTCHVFFFRLQNAILIFEAHRIGSDCWPQRLKFKIAEVNIHSIRVYTHSSQDILILMFCTSLRQFKVNVHSRISQSGDNPRAMFSLNYFFLSRYGTNPSHLGKNYSPEAQFHGGGVRNMDPPRWEI